MQLNARITAYDMLDSVQWTVRVWDTDDILREPMTAAVEFSGAMRGRGSDRPTKWLRELLEDIRSSM